MPPKELRRIPRSKSADAAKKITIKKGIADVFSHSLPVIGKKGRGDDKKPKKKKKKKKDQEEVVVEEPAPVRKAPPPKEKSSLDVIRRIRKQLTSLLLIVTYAFLGGILFSAIEGGYDQKLLLEEYGRNIEAFKRRQRYQQLLYKRFRDIDGIEGLSSNMIQGLSLEDYKLQLIREALNWYERKMGFLVTTPTLNATQWDFSGGIFYSVQLFTTIGYSNLSPKTVGGKVVSMLYALVGIPLAFFVAIHWGIFYFNILEALWNLFRSSFKRKEGVEDLAIPRRKGRNVYRTTSEASTAPLLSVKYTPTAEEVIRVSGVKSTRIRESLPLRIAFALFFLWICGASSLVRLWEKRWSFWEAFYHFFNYFLTIDVVARPSRSGWSAFGHFTLLFVAFTLLGLCIVSVQAKVRELFDRISASIDLQYKIRQVEADLSMMTLTRDGHEGIHKLNDVSRISDRLVFLTMDEHKKNLLKERWERRAGMASRITQTYQPKADKMCQTGNRVYDDMNGDEWGDSEDEDDEEEEEEEDTRSIVHSTPYIYTIYD